MDTIFALSTPPGRAALAIFRVSGPASGNTIHLLTGSAPPTPKKATLRRLYDPDTGIVLDHGLILWFPGPKSYTGEDMVEFHVHSGRAVIETLAANLEKIPKVRLAAPGDFTRRAFENGKLDLTQVEAIADLIAADTEGQRQQALRQMEGVLGKLYETWRQRLIKTLARIEAQIDFPEDIPIDFVTSVQEVIQVVVSEIALHLADGRRGERLRDGVLVAILGAPNIGKSSLFNALVGDDTAIVSSIAGTTRDIIEARLDLMGIPVLLSDTAGLHQSTDPIEAEGIRRAIQRAAQADIRITMFSAQTWAEQDPEITAQINQDSLIVINKCDLYPVSVSLLAAHNDVPENPPMLALSLSTGEGLDQLRHTLSKIVCERFSPGYAPVLSRIRHRQALQECSTHLERALTTMESELIGEDLRLAMRSLGRITGRVDVEDVLDVVFQEFCIGK